MKNSPRRSWQQALFGDTEVEAILSPDADLQRMLAVEAAWTRSLGQSSAVDKLQAEKVALAIENADIDYSQLLEGSARDGIPVPSLVKQLQSQLSDADNTLVHQGLTSQDVIDTALMLALQQVLPVFHQRLQNIIATLNKLKERDGKRQVMAYTRMQAAHPIQSANRIDSWTRPLLLLAAQSADMKKCCAMLQWGGPVGVRNQNLPAQTGALFAAALGLHDPGHAWHSERQVLADLAGHLSKLTNATGKLGQDIALQAQLADGSLELENGGRSSAMPHKNNPVLAELLSTLARINTGHLSLMHQALLHEQERSGTAWMMEWQVLPHMLVTTGRSLLGTQSLLDQIKRLGKEDD